MATVNSTLKLTDKMSMVFDKITESAHKTLNTLNQIEKANHKVDKSMQKVSTSSSSMFKGIMGANIVSKGIGMVTSQLDSAIKRFDTINNYRNVMAGLGFDETASQKSIDRLKKGLDGLPTTLDDAVSSVQRFAAVNENIGASTEMTLALNDALAAGGTPAATQAAALEQISQAYAKGKFDAMEYKSMMNAMPAQLKQVAKEMGYTSTAVGGDFYNALQQGKIGMNDMMKTMVNLDHATGGFHEQAINATKGIGTAFTNMKTAITKGLADIIQNINDSLNNAGLPTIDQMITNIGKSIKNALTNVGNAIGWIISTVGPVMSFVINNLNVITPLIWGVVAALGAYKAVQVALNIAKGVAIAIDKAETMYLAVLYAKEMLATGAKLSATAAQWGLNAALLACPLTWIILAIIAVIAVIFAVVAAINKARSATDEAAEGTISAVGIIMGILFTLAAFVWNNVLLPIYNGFVDTVNFLANCFKDPVTSIKILFKEMAVNVLDRIRAMIQGIQDLINLIPGVQVNLTGGLNNMLSTLKGSIEADKAAMGWEDVMQKKSTWDYSAAASAGYAKGANLFKGSTNKAQESTDYLADMDNLTNSITGNSNSGSGSGGKAIKTTSTDSNLLSDDDIQLLLDVATRDYKLNYQQITPEITLTFGDIRETVDIDTVLDKVADKLEDIYNGNLEVAY